MSSIVFLTSSIGVRATTFKCNIEEIALADQVKKTYELELYGTFKLAEPRSAAKHAQITLDSNTLHYIVGMPWAEDNIRLPDNFYASLSSLSLLKSV